MVRLTRPLSLCTLGLASLAILGGCRAVSLPFVAPPTDAPAALAEAAAGTPPAQLIAIWSDTTFQTAGKPATRGLGGRLYFYDAHRKAVPAAGQLIVYGYDDALAGGSHQTPNRKYVIPPEEFARHQSETDLGPSYSVWIPWDAVGSPQKPVSIVPVFTTVEGKVVMGDLARHVLPGHKVTEPLSPAAEELRAATADLLSGDRRGSPDRRGSLPGGRRSLATDARPVALAGFETAATAPAAASERLRAAALPAHDGADHPLRTTTIAVPPPVRERLLRSATVPAPHNEVPRAPGVTRQQVVTSPLAASPPAVPPPAPAGTFWLEPMPAATDPAALPQDNRPRHRPTPIPAAERGAAALPPRARFVLPRHQAPAAPAVPPAIDPLP